MMLCLIAALTLSEIKGKQNGTLFLSWFLNKIISQLLVKVPSHLTNTQQFLQQLQNTTFQTESVIESFDVTSLYTNVTVNDALQAVSEMLEKHISSVNTYALSRARILVLIFKWSGEY